jgi:3-oxoacyl-(acyl-carrier-protein) synthase
MSVCLRTIGVLSAYGRGMPALVAGMRAGICPRAPATGIGYPLDPPPLVSRIPAPASPPGEAGAAARLIDVAADALAQAGLNRDEIQAEDMALVVGTGGFLYASGAELYGRATGVLPNDTPFLVRGPDWGVALIGERFGLRGPCLAVSSGCSSSANALLLAAEMIARGRARRALVVGAEGLSAVTLSGFDSLLLLDPKGCRPFDRDRNGLQIGEAICAIVLEAHAEGEAFDHIALLCGGANRCDTHHLTSASPDGSVMRDVMREALASAGVGAPGVVAIKAHGTGSGDSDRAEAAALRAVFGDSPPPVLAFKRYLGHTLGGCGALETAALAGCVADGFLPAAAGFSEFDPELGLEPLRFIRPAQGGHYLLNFFGFGGNYTSLVLRAE